MENIHIIIVEPLYKGNVGSVARIMHNFGFYNLRIVGSIPTKEDFVMGAHSSDILEHAKIYNTFQEAITGLDRVIALSRRKGNDKKSDMNPMQLAEYVNECHHSFSWELGVGSCELNSQLPTLNSQLREGGIGLIFGRETFGLKDEEAELCDLRCYIPANENFPSINLAQAVAITLYEIYSHNQRKGNNNQEEANIADKNTIEEAISYSIEVLSSIDVFKSKLDKKKITDFLSSLLYRSNATKQMTIDFKKMFNRIYIKFYGKGKGYKL